MKFIVARDWQDYEVECRSHGIHRSDAMFVDDAQKVRGRYIDPSDVIVTAFAYRRPDYTGIMEIVGDRCSQWERNELCRARDS